MGLTLDGNIVTESQTFDLPNDAGGTLATREWVQQNGSATPTLDQVLAEGGAFTGNRAVALGGFALAINQGLNSFLSIDPTPNNELSQLQAYNITGVGNKAKIRATSSNTEPQFFLQADFNDGIKEAIIVGTANATESVITHTADIQTFNGDYLGAINHAGGDPMLILDDILFQAFLESHDGTANSEIRLRSKLSGGNVDFFIRSNNGTNQVSILGNANSNDITHTADIHSFTIPTSGGLFAVQADASDFLRIQPTSGDEAVLLRAINTTGGGNVSSFDGATTATDVSTILKASFNDNAKLAKITSAANVTTATITYEADTHNFATGDVKITALAGGGTTGLSIDNDGKLIRTP